MNLWRCNPTPREEHGKDTVVQSERKHLRLSIITLVLLLGMSSTWKCSCPGTGLWGNSGRNMETNPGKLHSALSMPRPTPANLSTCSGTSGALLWSIRRWPRPRAGGARRQMPAGIERPTVERKPRQPEMCPSSPSSEPLWRAGAQRSERQIRLGSVNDTADKISSCHVDLYGSHQLTLNTFHHKEF